MPPDALELVLLEHPQELRLQRGRQVPDLVQEERPSRRELEPTRLLAIGARECAALVSEQLGLEERLG